MKRAYQSWNPKPATMAQVGMAEEIIDEYEAEGYTLTLRQLYYQFVARGLAANSARSYKNLGTVITKARMAGLISWLAIEDRNREHHAYLAEEDEMNVLNTLEYGIQYDRWARQETYVEVWVEKEALGNVIERACRPWMVPHMACKGYLSASEAWRAGQRIRDRLIDGKKCVVIHLGDHDPSGIDMTRDNRDRLTLFSEGLGEGVEVVRIALNMDQVEEYEPPPNPAKVTDSRAAGYIRQYGRTSWELDALEPSVMKTMITREIRKYIDMDAWRSVEEEEEEKKRILRNVADRWDQIRPIAEPNDGGE